MEERIERWVAQLERLRELSEELLVEPQDFDLILTDMKEATQPVA